MKNCAQKKNSIFDFFANSQNISKRNFTYIIIIDHTDLMFESKKVIAIKKIKSEF